MSMLRMHVCMWRHVVYVGYAFMLCTYVMCVRAPCTLRVRYVRMLRTYALCVYVMYAMCAYSNVCMLCTVMCVAVYMCMYVCMDDMYVVLVTSVCVGGMYECILCCTLYV